jgi:Raf kinase inhibitor-like YbhB/YbcL family protein
MLEHVPSWLGHALSGLRAGEAKLAVADPALAPPAAMTLASAAFADGGRLPDRFTADAEGGAGVSPPLHWGDPPAGTARLALLVEDADSPTPEPLVHAIVFDLPPEAGQLAEGAIVADGAAAAGRNSYGREGWLPPDPPTGHGEHRYVFQLFALGADGGTDKDMSGGAAPGRSALVRALAGRVLAAGVLTGTYSRGDPAPVGPVGVTAPA